MSADTTTAVQEQQQAEPERLLAQGEHAIDPNAEGAETPTIGGVGKETT